MISFKNIRRYSDYKSYQRIKKVKYQQSCAGKKNCKKRTYQDYLNKISGFKCCKPGQNCCYCLTGRDGGNNCLNPPAGQVCCDCSGVAMYIKT